MAAPINYNKVDIKALIAKYVKLRDKKKEIQDKHKEELSPYNDAMATLEELFMGFLNNTGQDSASAKGFGTIYRNTKRSAVVADAEAFRAHVIETRGWDLADWRANAPAIEDFINTHGVIPPGVNFSTVETVGIRRG